MVSKRVRYGGEGGRYGAPGTPSQPGLVLPHLKHLVFEAKTFMLQPGQVQSPGLTSPPPNAGVIAGAAGVDASGFGTASVLLVGMGALAWPSMRRALASDTLY